MQKALILLLAFLIIFNMNVFCYADSFRDSCSSIEEFPYRKVYNLNVANDYLENFNFPLQDRTALEITDYSDYGEIIYEVNQVEEITFSLYRKYPSFAVKFLDDDNTDDDSNNLAYGIVPSAETYSLPIPLFMDESDDTLYCEDNDKWYFLTSDMAFEEVQRPQNPLIPYGAEVQVSNDGQTYDSIPLEMLAPKSLSDEYYLYEESFHAYLPEDTTHVKIRIKQVPTLKDRTTASQTTTYTPVNTKHTTMIHTIVFIGPKSEFNPEEKPDEKPDVISPTIIINPISKDEKPEKPSSTKPSTSERKSSSSSSSGSTRSGSTTTNETTTSDSNNTTNTTTTYTSNYYFINLGEENMKAIKEALAKVGIKVEDPEEPIENEEMPPEESEEVIRVIYDNSLTVGSSGGEFNPQTPPTSTDTTNQDNKILYLLAGGILASILIQIFHFLRQPDKSEAEVDLADSLDDEDDSIL